MEIEQITIPTKKVFLQRWKERDSSIVPEFALNWKGNGVVNGYGFGEWMAEKYFRSLGYYVINDEFDLFSKKSKYHRYNELIANIIGKEKMDLFSKRCRLLYQNDYKIENLDLFVFKTDSCFFAEVKKGTDFLRDPQIRFMYLAKELLETQSKVVYISDQATSISSELLSYEIDLLENQNL
jgi:hypothetical protein